MGNFFTEVKSEAHALETEATKENALVVEFVKGQQTFSEDVSIFGVTSREEIAPEIELWNFNKETDIQEIQKYLQEDPGVMSVEPNYKRQLHMSGDDPYMGSQWWISQVKPQRFWSRVKQQKKNVVVAVIDSGIDYNHEDLKGRVQPGGFNFYHDIQDVMDVNGHGTAVSGIIAATSENNVGISGITGTYNTKVLPLKVSHKSGESYISDEIRAIDYAIDKKVDVINISLGGPDYSSAENKAIQRAIQAGITVVSSAGNEALEGNALSYPASYSNVISVGAVDNQNRRASFSNYNSSVSVVAPGVNIYTTVLSDRYQALNGTSFSSPIVAGAAALVKASQPSATPKEIKSLLEETATDLGAYGKDSHFGAGLIDLEKLQTRVVTDSFIPVESIDIWNGPMTIDLDNQKSKSLAKVSIPKSLEGLRKQAVINYEVEPNNSFIMANQLQPGTSMVGTITNNYYDLDYYRFMLDSPGTFSMLVGWIENSLISHRDNRYLGVGVYDSEQKMIGVATLETTPDGKSFMYYSNQLPKGTYYLAVIQTSSYKYVFTNERYMITSLFTPSKKPDPIPEIKPSFLFDGLFINSGSEEQFVLDTEPSAKFTSSNENVATINTNGTIRAVGYGSTRIRYVSDTITKEAQVKVPKNSNSATKAFFESISPSNATDQTVLWTSSDPLVAEVDEYGIITGKKAGSATVTVQTKDGGLTASSTVTVIGGKPKEEFVGTFPAMTVKQDKIFTVTFNQNLQAGKDYNKDIIISRLADGSKSVTSFTTEVDPLSRNKLYIKPNIKWEEGEHYLSITKGLQNEKATPLKETVRLKFDVEANYEVQHIDEAKNYERVLRTMP
ncbi:S8 family serine peptidase [Sporosarcina sp. PTS2304]|uniref:S8 family serine peptidase n=1 Tax=Sporosarcina sp. PTS2304 TaxID=2283194 RepID=UPI0013B36B3B|nr:S8 family serine peptidase [Sporosarcina sp. PTS2304]